MKISTKIGIFVGSTAIIAVGLTLYMLYMTLVAGQTKLIVEQHKESTSLMALSLDILVVDVQSEVDRLGVVRLFKRYWSDESEPDDVAKRMEEYISGSDRWYAMLLVDTQGIVLESTSRAVGNHDIIPLEEITVATRQNESYMSDVLIWGSEAVIFVSTPLENDNGVVQGSVVVVVDWLEMVRLVRQVNRGNEPLHVLAQNGTELISGNEGDDDDLLVENYSDQAFFAEVVEKGEGAWQGEGFHGEMVIMSFVSLDVGNPYNLHRWYLLRETDIDVALAPVKQQLVQIFMRMFFTGVVTVLICYIFIRMVILMPLHRIQKAALAYSHGDLSKRVKLDSSDELGLLADTFNAMASRLEVFTTNLEKTVAERTKELVETRKSLEKTVSIRTKELERVKVSLEAEVVRRTDELKKKLKQLEIVNKSVVDREIKMVKIKEELKEVRRELAKLDKEYRYLIKQQVKQNEA